MSFFWVGHFEFFFRKKKHFFCFIPMKISPNLYGRMDGCKFWCFPGFSENSLLCLILRYTVYLWPIPKYNLLRDNKSHGSKKFKKSLLKGFNLFHNHLWSDQIVWQTIPFLLVFGRTGIPWFMLLMWGSKRKNRGSKNRINRGYLVVLKGRKIG